MKRLLLAFIAAAFFTAAGNAQSNANVTLNVNQTPANNGRIMFNSYCAPCHGINGRGNGPVAASLKVPPADLTLLSSNVPAHGSAEMPVWGPIFGSMSPNQTAIESLRISNLVRYLKTIQRK
jgi:mono/diheme cytochrome c family protein